MVNGEQSQPPTVESETLQLGGYGQSVDQLLGLLEVDNDGQEPLYYSVAWDPERPTQVVDITLATVAATGASRQWRWGQFYQAQYGVEEKYVDGSSRGRRHIWCSTPPRSPGTPIILDDGRLAEEYGYLQLNPENIITELVGRATSVDDYVALTALMRQRGIDSTPDLEKGLRRLMGSLVHRSGDKPFDIEAVLGLADTYRGLSSVLAPAIQSRLVSLLLREIRGLPPPGEQEVTGDAEAAVVALTAALEQGLIPDEHRTLDRILATPTMYRFRFATDLLHAHLRDTRHYRPLRIFSFDRLDFTRLYIAHVADAITEDSDIKQYLATYTTGYSLEPSTGRQESRLCRLVDGLSLRVSGSASANSTSSVTNITAIAASFGNVLDKLSTSPDADSKMFIRRAVEVVGMLLAPHLRWQRRQVGKCAVEQATASSEE